MSAVPQSNHNGAPTPDVGAMSAPMAVGQVMARSGLFPDITRVSQAVVKVLAGRELGIGPFAAMSDIHVIDGKPVLGARILAALVRQSPVYDYEVIEWTNERCELAFFRSGTRLEPTVAFTDADADLAGLNKPTRSGKPSNHMKYPRNMKFARAMSNGVGLHCPTSPRARRSTRPTSWASRTPRRPPSPWRRRSSRRARKGEGTHRATRARPPRCPRAPWPKRRGRAATPTPP